MVDVAKINAKWRRVKEAQRVEVQDSSVAEERGSESQWRVKREGSSEREGSGVESKAASEKRGQSKTGQLSSKDGGSQGTRARQRGKTDTVASKSKGVGRVKQSGRKGKGASDKS